MRSYLVSVLGLFVALMAFGLSQAQASLNHLHVTRLTPDIVDAPLIEEAPSLPRRKMAASLLGRNTLRVHYSSYATDADEPDTLMMRRFAVMSFVMMKDRKAWNKSKATPQISS
ncbi:hypothetical protein ACP3VZ_01260 [Vibrio sp. PNB22_2_2]